jgi:hypothetical protein
VHSAEPLPPPSLQSSQSQPRIKIEKEDVYEPEFKKVVPPPLLTPTEEGPAGTIVSFLERIKKHPSYAYFFNYKI